MTPSRTHLVLVQAAGQYLDPRPAITGALEHWAPVWVVVDPRAEPLPEMGVKVAFCREGDGKGSAIRHAAMQAERCGFTHVLVLAPHDAALAPLIPGFMAASQENRRAMILGQPDPSASKAREWCDRIVRVITNSRNIGAAQCGFRVYPIRPLLESVAAARGIRGDHFDAEIVVRMRWRGVRPIKRPAPGADPGPDRAQLKMHMRLMRRLVTRK